jgi:hypothetical protein
MKKRWWWSGIWMKRTLISIVVNNAHGFENKISFHINLWQKSDNENSGHYQEFGDVVK